MSDIRLNCFICTYVIKTTTTSMKMNFSISSASKANDILNIQDSTCPDNLVIRVAGYKTYDLSKKECRVKCVSDNEATARDNVPNVNTQTLHVLSLDCW